MRRMTGGGSLIILKEGIIGVTGSVEVVDPVISGESVRMATENLASVPCFSMTPFPVQQPFNVVFS